MHLVGFYCKNGVSVYRFIRVSLYLRTYVTRSPGGSKHTGLSVNEMKILLYFVVSVGSNKRNLLSEI